MQDVKLTLTHNRSQKKKHQWDLWNDLWNILNTNYLSGFSGFSEGVSCFPELTGWVFASPIFPMIPASVNAEKVGRHLPTFHFPFPDPTRQPTAWWLHWNQDLCPYWLLQGIDDFLQNQGHLKGSTMKVDVYTVYICTCISSCLKKTCHFKGGSTGGHSQDKRSTKLQYYKWTWPLTMHPFKTIHENMTWDIFRNDNSWKCKLIPLRALGNQLNSLWDVLYLCLILVSVSVMFDLFLQQFYSPKMGPNAWPRTHTLPTPLFETPRDRPRSVFLPTPWTWRPLPEMGLIFFPGWDVNVNLVL